MGLPATAKQHICTKHGFVLFVADKCRSARARLARSHTDTIPKGSTGAQRNRAACPSCPRAAGNSAGRSWAGSSGTRHKPRSQVPPLFTTSHSRAHVLHVQIHPPQAHRARSQDKGLLSPQTLCAISHAALAQPSSPAISKDNYIIRALVSLIPRKLQLITTCEKNTLILPVSNSVLDGSSSLGHTLNSDTQQADRGNRLFSSTSHSHLQPLSAQQPTAHTAFSKEIPGEKEKANQDDLVVSGFKKKTKKQKSRNDPAKALSQPQNTSLLTHTGHFPSLYGASRTHHAQLCPVPKVTPPSSSEQPETGRELP